jgi:hypothetical protein
MTVMGAAAATRKQRPKVAARQAQSPRKTPSFRGIFGLAEHVLHRKSGIPPASHEALGRCSATGALRERFFLFD